MSGGNLQKSPPPSNPEKDEEEDYEEEDDDAMEIEKDVGASSFMKPSLFTKSQQPPVFYVSGLDTPPFVYKGKEKRESA